jgi:hypothetical protein
VGGCYGGGASRSRLMAVAVAVAVAAAAAAMEYLEIYSQMSRRLRVETLRGCPLIYNRSVGSVRLSAANSARAGGPFNFQYSTLCISGARLTSLDFGEFQHIKDQQRTHSTVKMTLQFKRSTRLKAQGSVPRVLRFFI